MKGIKFDKYHGAGNDFIMLDGTKIGNLPVAVDVQLLCDRHLGIGADGLIVVSPGMSRDKVPLVEMYYFNADGSGGMMCANGARCAIAYARVLGMLESEATLICCGLEFNCSINSDNTVKIGFPDLEGFKKIELGYWIDTGAPHLVRFEKLEHAVAYRKKGREMRYHTTFHPEGLNVNFIHPVSDNHWMIITYERGVEDLTLACGTGALAAAMAISAESETMGLQSYDLESKGGLLKVSFNRTSFYAFSKLSVSGPVVHAFSGRTELIKSL